MDPKKQGGRVIVRLSAPQSASFRLMSLHGFSCIPYLTHGGSWLLFNVLYSRLTDSWFKHFNQRGRCTCRWTATWMGSTFSAMPRRLRRMRRTEEEPDEEGGCCLLLFQVKGPQTSCLQVHASAHMHTTILVVFVCSCYRGVR
jgi:hypothetical protein